MIFIKKSKLEQLILCKIREKIAFILLDKFFNYLDYIKKNL